MHAGKSSISIVEQSRAAVKQAVTKQNQTKQVLDMQQDFSFPVYLTEGGCYERRKEVSRIYDV
jgi:hypothetical protein